MKLTTSVVLASIALSAQAMPLLRRVDASLIPEFGFSSGVNPTGTGDCDGAVNGANGQPIKIPCSCPPDRQFFIDQLNANVAAGHAVNNPSVQVSFPTDNSKDAQLARINTALVTLQNLRGPGVGCPAVSTTFLAQQKAIQDGTAPPPAAAAAPPPPPPQAAAPPPPPPSNDDVVARLAPQLGFTSGRNPTGTGDCDGAVNGANGQPIKIPCSCPPSQEDFVNALKANVAAGRAVNNPGVQISFPTDDSKDAQLARINAGLITLQNLRGPGVGCPAVSSTLQAQAKAIQDGTAPPPPAAAAPPPPPPQAAAPPPPPPSNDDPVARLAPQLGFTAGRNPTGTGDCDGAVNGANGQPIKIPCSCPPSQADFVNALKANVAAGHAVNNPGVQVPFPLDDSKDAQLARINAGLITLQNLRGPGVGCPAVSSTLQAQQRAIQG